FSLGGLVLRNACHRAHAEALGWLSRVRRAFYLGTPHQGSPLERAGRALSRLLRAIPDPYTRLIAELGDLRSEGIKDLGDPAHPLALLPGIRHHLVAASLARDPTLALFGDLLVPLGSATGAGRVAPDRVRVVAGASHLQLAHDPRVYELIRDWCREEIEASP
ncbi:MAG: alpha/beta hydrolase, partial [Acidobacteriota bacterium]